MNDNNIVRNIIYVDHTSTSKEFSCHGDSNKPDTLLNIMRDNVIVPTTDSEENPSIEQSEKNNISPS